MSYPGNSVFRETAVLFLPPALLKSPVNLVIHVKSTKITMRAPGTSQKPAFLENPMTLVIEVKRRRKKLLRERSVRNMVRCPRASTASGDCGDKNERPTKYKERPTKGRSTRAVVKRIPRTITRRP